MFGMFKHIQDKLEGIDSKNNKSDCSDVSILFQDKKQSVNTTRIF